MAEGGGEFGYEDPDLDNQLDHDDDEQEVDRTQPFQPGASSTPYNRGEQIEMQTMQHEQSGLPSYQETTFSGRPVSTEEIERRLNALRDKNTGLLDMSQIQLQNILLSEEDKQKEIQRVKKLIKDEYPMRKSNSWK